MLCAFSPVTLLALPPLFLPLSHLPLPLPPLPLPEGGPHRTLARLSAAKLHDLNKQVRAGRGRTTNKTSMPVVTFHHSPTASRALGGWRSACCVMQGAAKGSCLLLCDQHTPTGVYCTCQCNIYTCVPTSQATSQSGCGHTGADAAGSQDAAAYALGSGTGCF